MRRIRSDCVSFVDVPFRRICFEPCRQFCKLCVFLLGLRPEADTRRIVTAAVRIEPERRHRIRAPECVIERCCVTVIQMRNPDFAVIVARAVGAVLLKRKALRQCLFDLRNDFVEHCGCSLPRHIKLNLDAGAAVAVDVNHAAVHLVAGIKQRLVCQVRVYLRDQHGISEACAVEGLPFSARRNACGCKHCGGKHAGYQFFDLHDDSSSHEYQKYGSPSVVI